MLDARALTATPHGACTVSMLTLIGGLAALGAVARLVRGVWTYFLRPGKDLAKLGEWCFFLEEGRGGRRTAACVTAWRW
jgi:hypothetical protein